MAIAATVAAIGMISCAKEGDNGGIVNDKPISVALTLTENTASRAVAQPVAEETVDFSSGYVIFTNGVDIINKVTEIAAGSYVDSPDAAAKAEGTKVWIEDMKTNDGEIKNVPAAATKVYIVGNLPAGVTPPALTENISAVKDRVINFASQGNAIGSVADVTLYGDGVVLTAHPNLDLAAAGMKYAKVYVNAIASRIEIGSISYSNPATEFVTGFQIDGIFINHYYPQMSLSSKVSEAVTHNAPINNTAADDMYVPGSPAYPVAASGKLFDYDSGTDGLGERITDISWKAAATTDVWAYNVLAPTSFDGTKVTALATPHIVIRLSNLTTLSDDMPAKVYPGTQYLTVKEFRKTGTNTVIESFTPGYIYYITNLTFNESNLTDIPEAVSVTVYVEAVLMTWTREEVSWGF